MSIPNVDTLYECGTALSSMAKSADSAKVRNFSEKNVIIISYFRHYFKQIQFFCSLKNNTKLY